MILRILISAVVLAGGLSTAFAQADSVWTLERCIEQALRASPRLQAGRAVVAGAEAAADEANAMRWPTATLNGAYNYTSETMEFQVQGPPIPGYTPPTISFGDGNVYDAALQVRYPVYGGGAAAAKARAGTAGLRAARSELGVEHLTLLYDVRRAYYSALGAEAKAGAARQSVERLRRHLDEITAAAEAGAASDETRLTAEARLRQAEGAMLLADADVTKAQLALGGLLMEPGTAVIPHGLLNQPLFDERDVPPEAVPRPEIAALDSRVEQSEYLRRAARGVLLPSLSTAAAWHYAKPGVNLPQNEWMDYYTVGVTASWTLWDFRARTHRTRQAHAAVRQLAAKRDELQAAIETQQHTALTALHAARAARGKAFDRMELERQRLTLAEGRLRTGMASESEYLDAQDDFTAAQTELAAALVRVRLAEADVLLARGY